MEIPSFLSALCLPLASTAGYGPFVTSLTSWGAFTLINLICIYGLCESPSADGLGNSMTYLSGGGEHVISEGYVCEKMCGTRE